MLTAGVVAAMAWWQLWMVRPMGLGPAGLGLDAALFRSRWSDRPVVLLGLGDSVTAGFGASPGHSFFERLLVPANDEAPEAAVPGLPALFPNLTATNIALSGSTSLHHARSQVARLNPFPTNVLGIVVMTTGGNDLIHNYGRTPPSEGAMYGATWMQAGPWITGFSNRLETMIAGIRRAFPGGCQIFLANIYDPTDGLGDLSMAGLPDWKDAPRIHHEYNQLISGAADRHQDVHLVDLYHPFLGHGIHCRQFWREHYHGRDPYYWFHANLEDPNDRGYDAIRRLFLKEMTEVFGRGSSSVDRGEPVPASR